MPIDSPLVRSISGLEPADDVGARSDVGPGENDSPGRSDRPGADVGVESANTRGGFGDDNLTGTNGNDRIFGFFGDDTMDGLDGRDLLSGGLGDDIIDGGAGNDVIFGGLGHDIMTGGEGDDLISGGLGTDTAVFSGSILDYDFDFLVGNSIRVTDLNTADGDDGSDLVRRVEILEFNDYTYHVDGDNAPLIVAGPQSTDEDTTGSFTVSAFDFDSDGLSVVGVTSSAGLISVTGTSSTGAPFGVGLDISLSFDPNGEFDALAVGESDTVTAEITVEDTNGNQSTVSFEITVNGVNDNPVADDDVVTIDEDAGTVTIDLNDLVSDVDASDIVSVVAVLAAGDSVAFNVVDGVVTLDADQFNALAFDEDASFTLTYTADDGNGGTDTGVVTVNVGGVNDDPTAEDDTVDTDETADPVDIDLNALVSDADGDTPTITVDSVQTAGGDPVVFTEVGGVVTIDPGQFGNLAATESVSVIVSYTADDGNGGTDTGAVTVNVAGVNDDPVADDDTVNTDEDQAPVDIDLNALVSDADGDTPTITVDSVQTAGGDPVVFTEVGGVVTIDPGQFDGLAATESVSVIVSYTADDGNGGTDTGQVTVNVGGVNDDPVADDDTVNTDEDAGVVEVDLTALVSDVDASDILSITVTSVTGEAVVYTVDNGVVSFDAGQFNGLGQGDTAVFTIGYTVDDGNGGTDTGEVTVNVAGVNDDPVAADDTVETNEDAGTVQIDLNALVDDADGDIQLISVTGATGDPVTFDFTDGVVSFDAGQFDSLALGESASFVLNYETDDGNGGTDTGAVTVNVAGRNDTPELTPNSDPVSTSPLIEDFDLTVDEADGSFTVDVAPFFQDPDTSDTLTFSVQSVIDPDTGRAVQIPVAVVGGILTFDPRDFGLNAGETTTYQVTVQADDGSGVPGSIGSGSFNLTVNGSADEPPANTNTAPVAQDAVFDVDTSDDIVIDLNALFSDADSGQTPMVISIGFIGGGRGEQVAFSLVNGVITIDPASLNVPDGAERTVEFLYTVDDGSGAGNATATGTVTLNVSGVPGTTNTAPVAADDTVDIDEDNGPLAVDLNALISDDDGDTPTVVAVQLGGENGNVPFTLVNGVVTFDPADVGVADGVTVPVVLTYQIDDGSGEPNSGATGTVTINVTGVPGVNTAPDAGDGALTVNEADGSAVLDLSAFASDADGDNLTVTGATLLVDNGSGTLVDSGVTITPLFGTTVFFDPADFGLDNLQSTTAVLRYTVDDGSGAGNATATGDVTLTINGSGGSGNNAPVANNGTETIDVEATTGIFTIDLSALVSDADAGDVPSFSVDSFTLSSEDTGDIVPVFNVDPVSGEVTFDLSQFSVPDGTSLVGTLIYTVDDGSGAPNSSASAAVNLTLTNPADPITSVVLDFEEFTATGAQSAVVAETDVVDEFIFSGDVSLVNTDLIDETGSRSLQGFSGGQTTPGGSSVIIGTSGIETRNTADPTTGNINGTQEIEVDFALYADDAILRVGDENTINLFSFQVSEAEPFAPFAGAGALGESFDLDSFSLNVLGNAGQGNNDPVTGEVVFYTLGATANFVGTTFTGYSYQLYAFEALSFTADADTGADETVFTAQAVDPLPAGVIIADDPLIYGVTFATDDGSAIVLDDLSFLL